MSGINIVVSDGWGLDAERGELHLDVELAAGFGIKGTH